MNSISNKLIAKNSIQILNNYKLKRIEYCHLISCNKSVAAAAAKYAAAVTYIFLFNSYKQIKNLIEGKKPKIKEYPPDTVILYQFPRAYKTPTLSMFALKLETWIRAADIKYQNEYSMKRSSQGLIPFIKLNNYVVEDSQTCIEYLSKVMQKDFNNHLNEEQKAVSRLVIKLCDDSLKWSTALLRFWYSEKNIKEMKLPFFSTWIFGYRVYKAGLYSGYSNFSKEELIERAYKDLKALNVLLGDKKFLFSDAKPCDADFALFGNIAQIIYNNIEPLNLYIITDCQNLSRHADNMKRTYWKDWDTLILANRVRAPSKSSSSSWIQNLNILKYFKRS